MRDNKLMIYLHKFIFLFFNIFYIILNLEVNADYLLDQFEENNDDLPKIKLKAEHLQYPMPFNNEIGDFLIVRVFGPNDPGNGILIANKNDFYYLLTSGHIVGGLSEGMSVDIQTIDKQFHSGILLKKSNNFDAALIRFKSKRFYYTSIIRPDFKSYKGLQVELIGFSLPSNAVPQASLRKTVGRIIGVLDKNIDGYKVLYSNATNIGMSGSGLFAYPGDGAGLRNWGNNPCITYRTPHLVAIHGRGEEYFTGGKSGVNLGISIHDLISEFKLILSKENIDSFPKEEETRIWKDGCSIYPSVRENSPYNSP